MAKDPAVLFYTNDFLSGTFTMTDEQVGKYIRLLCIQHQKGYLTEKDMLNICKTYDEDVYSKFVKENSKYYNERMRSEADKRRKYSESRRNNRKTIKDDNICKTYVQHMENEDENINEDINKLISYWNSVYGKCLLIEQEFIQELFNKFGFKHSKRLIREFKELGFYKIPTMRNALDEKGKIKSKEESEGITIEKTY